MLRDRWIVIIRVYVIAFHSVIMYAISSVSWIQYTNKLTYLLMVFETDSLAVPL